MPMSLLRRLPAPRLLSRSSPARLARTPAPRSMASAADTAAAAAPQTRLTAVSSRIRDEYQRGPDVWSLFSPLVFPGATNLGQGFMSWAPPPFVRDALLSASGERVDTHHYSHAKGRPRLRAALAEYLGPSVHKPAPGAKDVPSDLGAPKLREGAEKLDIETEVQVTAGANGGIYAAMTAFLEPGDEVLMFEPYFDQYICEVTYLGGKPVFVPLQPPADASSRIAGADEWSVDWDALEKAFGSGKVKAMILNTPHNPIGKVFSRDELSRIAALAIKHDVLVISDEVYDCLTYDGHEHIRIAAFEGMWERTLTVGSAGKSFACTGWRIGWLVGPPHLIKPALVAHTRIVFTCNSAASEAAAIGLEQASSQNFFPTQIAEYAERRALLTGMLDNLGIKYTQPHGSYFVLADFARLRIPEDFELPEEIKRRPRDFHMAWFVAKTCNVVTIPATAFVSDEHAGLYENYLRWSFCKGADEIAQATERLEKLRPYLE